MKDLWGDFHRIQIQVLEELVAITPDDHKPDLMFYWAQYQAAHFREIYFWIMERTDGRSIN